MAVCPECNSEYIEAASDSGVCERCEWAMGDYLLPQEEETDAQRVEREESEHNHRMNDPNYFPGD